MSQRPAVLIIYTGGTIGMLTDARTGTLLPMDLEHLEEQVPELHRTSVRLQSIAFQRPIDSSDMRPKDWVRIASLIAEHYEDYDGFVVLHGSDTMAYTASALSFLLEGLGKPVILTGSQLPIGTIRTDGKENLVTAIEIAAAKGPDGGPMVPEVAIYFEYGLYRGNRTVKVSAERFEAFRSPNYPMLAEAGVHIRYDRNAILPRRPGPLVAHANMDQHVGLLKLHPGISDAWVRQALATPELKAVVIETFGNGNGPNDEALLNVLREARERGVVLINVTQCIGGSVDQGRYETSRAFLEMGVVGGSDITTEAALAKAMFLLGKGLSQGKMAEAFSVPICGEMTLSTTRN